MAVWMVRHGKYGEQEEIALEKRIITIGWDKFPDMSQFRTKEELIERFKEIYPNDSKIKISIGAGQLWRFSHEIEEGDLVVVPLKTSSAVAFAKVTGPYKYREDIAENVRHTRKVKWLRIDVPRSSIPKDIRFSMGANLTVCAIKREGVEERLIKIIEGKEIEEDEKIVEEEEPILDLERLSKDNIISYISEKFIGSDFERLVEQILKAQGYFTKRTLPGKDGGADILAGAGPLGCDRPRILVEAKSGKQVIDSKELRSFKGSMDEFGAEQGLYVSWGGFTKDARKEIQKKFFKIRLWEADDVIDAIFKYYDKFSDEFKAELPLKRILTLAIED